MSAEILSPSGVFHPPCSTISKTTGNRASKHFTLQDLSWISAWIPRPANEADELPENSITVHHEEAHVAGGFLSPQVALVGSILLLPAVNSTALI